MFVIRFVVVAALLGLSTGSASAETVRVRVPIGDATLPIVKKTVNPSYPKRASKKDLQGWVWLGFVVEVNGKTSNIEILDSYPPGIFDKSAMRAVSRWIYEPATRNGAPVSQEFDLVMTFNIEGSSGTSRKFHRTVKEIEIMIRARDFKSAADKLKDLENNHTGGPTAYTYVRTLYANYHIAKQEFKEAARYLRLISSSDWTHLSPASQIAFQSVHFRIEVQLSEFTRAHFVYQNIKDNSALPIDDPVHEIYKKIQPILDGSNAIASSGEVIEQCDGCATSRSETRFELYRMSVTIQNLSGVLNTLRFECGNNWALMTYRPDSVWELPEEYGQCTVRVEGDAGSTFDLVELG